MRSILGLLAVTLLLVGCEWVGRDEETLRPNERPTVRITGGATEGQPESYRVEFFWYGSDVDGTIDHFLIAVDDTCLCTYEVTEEVLPPGSDVPVTVVTEVQATDPDSCRVRGIEPAYEHPDSIWRRVDGFSANLAFTADEVEVPDGSPPLSTAWHTFFVKAVDDRAGVSRADTRTFNAVTIAPVVEIDGPLGNGAERFASVGSHLTVSWHGRDDDSSDAQRRPAGYQMKLIELDSVFEADDLVIRYITHPIVHRANDLIPEDRVVPDDVALTDSTYHATDWYPKRADAYDDDRIALRSLPAGNFAFALRAVDEAGAVTPDEGLSIAAEGAPGNVLKLDVNPSYPVSPVLEITEETLLGRHRFIARGSEWEAEVPVNTPLRFTWTADASHYGGEVAEFNYAIDIEDPGCEVCQSDDGFGGWIGWGNHAGVTQEIRFGEEDAGEEHVLFVRVRDRSFDEERETLAIVRLNVIAFAFDRTALWVDDYKASGVLDCEHDLFVRDVLDHATAPYRGVGEPLYEFEARRPAGECQESSTPVAPTLSLLSRYRVIFWNVAASGAGSTLGLITDNNPDNEYGEFLRIYLRAGGNLVVWGRFTIGALLGDFYPSRAYEPELPSSPNPNFGPDTFLWESMKFRTRFDRVGRDGLAPFSIACSGLVGLEVAEEGRSLGYPAGVVDPTGFSDREAIWHNFWAGASNPYGALADAPLGTPQLVYPGIDTLYTFVANSWSYPVEDVGSTCRTAFGSPFHEEPVVLRIRDVETFQGRIIWIGTSLRDFSDSVDDVKAMMRLNAGWILDP